MLDEVIWVGDERCHNESTVVLKLATDADGIGLETAERVTRLRLLMIVSVVVAILSTLNRAGAQDIVQSPAIIAGTISGWLATVEPARRRMRLVPVGEARMVELDVAEHAVIVQAEQPLSLPDLVVQVGKLVTVAYRLEGHRWIAERVTIEASAEEA